MIRLTQLLNEVQQPKGKKITEAKKLDFKKVKSLLKKFRKSKPKKTKNAFDPKKKKSKLSKVFGTLLKKAKRLTEASDAKIEALIDAVDIDQDEIDEIEDNGYSFDTPEGEYIVVTDSEADEMVKEYIEQSVWAFNTWFLLDHIDQEAVNDYYGLEDTYYDEDEDEEVEIGDAEEVFYANMGETLEDHIKSLQDKNEIGSNEIIKLIDDFDEFVEDAVRADGRGHFLSGYDGDELESGKYFIYRIN